MNEKPGPAKTFVRLLLLAFITWPATNVSAETFRIKLDREEVATSKSTINLGDICQVTGATALTSKKIKDLDLHLFSDDQPVTITSQQIKVRLLLAGFSSGDFSIDGQSVTVSRQNAGWLEDQAHRIIKNELARQFGLAANDIEIAVPPSKELERLYQQLVPGKMELVPLFGNQLPLGQTSVMLRYKNSRGRPYTVNLPLEISVLKEVMVTRSPIKKGDVISANAVFPVKRPLAAGESNIADQSCIGCTASSDIGAHQVVLTQYVQPDRQKPRGQGGGVKANSYVRVRIERGGFSASLMVAKALNSGAVGDRVLVQNIDSGKRFTAIVKDSQTLIIP